MYAGAQTQPGAWDSLDYIDRKGGMGGDGVSQDAQGTLSTSSSQPSRERKRKSRKRGGDAMDTPGSFTTPDVRWDLKAEVKVHLTDMGGSTTQMRRWACFPLLLQPTKKPATTPVEDRAVEVQEFCEVRYTVRLSPIAIRNGICPCITHDMLTPVRSIRQQ